MLGRTCANGVANGTLQVEHLATQRVDPGVGKVTRASSPHCTVWKDAATSGWAAVLATYVARGVLVAIPISTP